MVIYRFARAVLRGLYAVLFRMEVQGREHIPEEGAVILCSNHISNWDPVTIGIPLRRQVHYMAKEELFRVPGLGWLIRRFGAFPVKRGGVSKESIKTTLALLRGGSMLGIFPEGTRRASENEAAKRGAATFALKTGATVIPVAIVGPYRYFRPLRVFYGPPLDLSEQMKDGSAGAVEAASQKIMIRIRELAAKN